MSLSGVSWRAWLKAWRKRRISNGGVSAIMAATRIMAGERSEWQRWQQRGISGVWRNMKSEASAKCIVAWRRRSGAQRTHAGKRHRDGGGESSGGNACSGVARGRRNAGDHAPVRLRITHTQHGASNRATAVSRLLLALWYAVLKYGGSGGRNS